MGTRIDLGMEVEGDGVAEAGTEDAVGMVGEEGLEEAEEGVGVGTEGGEKNIELLLLMYYPSVAYVVRFRHGYWLRMLISIS